MVAEEDLNFDLGGEQQQHARWYEEEIVRKLVAPRDAHLVLCSDWSLTSCAQHPLETALATAPERPATAARASSASL